MSDISEYPYAMVKSPWINHPIRKELQALPSEFGLVRGAMWMIGGFFVIWVLVFQFGAENSANASSGLLWSLVAVAGFWAVALAMKPLHLRHAHKLSWVADTTPAEPMTLKATGEGRALILTLTDSIGSEVARFEPDAFAHSELPVRWPASVAVNLHRQAGTRRNVILVWPGQFVSGELINIPKALPFSGILNRILGPILVLLVGGFFLAMASANSKVYFNFRSTYELGEAARHWPLAKGRVIHAKVETSSYVRGSSKYSRKVTVEVFRPALQYDYAPEVPGPRLRRGSDVLWGLGWLHEREKAEAILTRYPVGSEIQVHYDPRDPQTAVIEPGSDPNVVEEMQQALQWLAINGSIGLLLAGLSLRRIRQRWSPPA